MAIDKAWQSYRAMVVPKGAADVQVRETRQAFYAGASILFYMLMNAMSSGDEPTDQDMAIMEGLQREIDEFGTELDLSVFAQPSADGAH